LSGFGDLSMYHGWARNGFANGRWPVFDYGWVYPIGALLPVALVGIAPSMGTSFVVWLLGATVINLWAIATLVRRGSRGQMAAWWWIVFFALLGPAALTRLEAFTTPLALIAVAMLVERAGGASALLAVAGWIKIAPAVVLMPLVGVLSRPVRQLVVPALAVSAGFLVWALAGGAGARVLSFSSEQSGRGLQIESVAASAWQVASVWDAGIHPHRDLALQTYEFASRSADRVASALDVLLIASIVVITVLAAAARRRTGANSQELMALVVLSTGLALFVFNKVGSPQYLCWGAAGVVLCLLVTRERDVLGIVPAIVMATAAVLTQIVFPIGYTDLLAGREWVVLTLVLRNLLLTGLLCWTIFRMVAVARRPITTEFAEEGVA